jgi:hypothetical protein
MLLCLGSAALAEVRVVVTPANGAPPPARSQAAPRAKSDTGPSYQLWVPFFEVDGNNPAGVTTLFAVRNRGAHTVNVHYWYYQPDVSGQVVRTGTLAPHQTQTINIRDVPGIAADPATGFKRGFVVMNTDDYSPTLMGDFFRVDPTNNFASGDALVSADTTCHHWDSRFLNGGPFTGGTTFTFFLGLNDSGGISPAVVGQVYDEPGTHRGTVQIYTADHVFEVNTAELPAAILGTFGAIEWTVQNPIASSVILATYRASGRYSVEVPSMCADELLD